ncbi:MAG: hypothetical protein JO149_07945 [Gammaproteobacteria bacterium]|nr:hypothetical protein [Gammaproteobacteria bacterium]
MKSTKNWGLTYLKQGILLFWGMWFLIAFFTNVTDFLISTHIVTPIAFRSGNYHALEKVLSIYHTPTYFLNLLFSMDILVQGSSAILFLIAGFSFVNKEIPWKIINTAFFISMALWAAFLVMEEIFIAYSFEGTHIGLFEFELISLLTLHLLIAVE